MELLRTSPSHSLFYVPLSGDPLSPQVDQQQERTPPGALLLPSKCPAPCSWSGEENKGPGQTAGQGLPFLLCASVSLTAKWQQDQRLSQSLVSQSANISGVLATGLVLPA